MGALSVINALELHMILSGSLPTGLMCKLRFQVVMSFLRALEGVFGYLLLIHSVAYSRREVSMGQLIEVAHKTDS